MVGSESVAGITEKQTWSDLAFKADALRQRLVICRVRATRGSTRCTGRGVVS